MARKGPKPNLNGCSLEGCEKAYHAKNYCRNHYANFNATGDPLGARHKRNLEPMPDCECGKQAISRKHAKCRSCYQLWWYANRLGVDPKPERHKAEVKYSGAHYRVRAARGYPSGYDCVNCGSQAQEWALSNDATDLRYGESSVGRGDSVAYSLNVYSYLPMCKDCHIAYDAEARGHTYRKSA